MNASILQVIGCLLDLLLLLLLLLLLILWLIIDFLNVFCFCAKSYAFTLQLQWNIHVMEHPVLCTPRSYTDNCSSKYSSANGIQRKRPENVCFG